MRQKFYITLLCVSAGILFSCRDEDPFLEVADYQQTQVFQAEGNHRSVTIKTNAGFTAVSSDETWCRAEVLPDRQTDNLRINVERNGSPAPRTATVTVSAKGAGDVVLTVSQTAMVPFITVANAEKGISLRNEMLEFNLLITTNIPIAIRLPDWIHEKGQVDIIYSFEMDAPPPSGEQDLREGDIIIESADENIPVTPVVVHVRHAMTFATADEVVGRPGNKRAVFELAISNDEIKTVKVVCVENGQSQETDINFRSGNITVEYTGLEEGQYQFAVICIDRYGNEAVPIGVGVYVYGDIYQNSVVLRPVSVATRFGNGYAIVLGAASNSYSEFFYKDGREEDVMLRVPNSEQVVYLYSDGSGFSRIDYYLPEPTAVDLFKTEKTPYAGNIGNRYAVVTSSTAAVIRAGDFDLGGEGVGFHDSNTTHDPGAGGATYRSSLGDYLSDAVDIFQNAGNINYVNNGEWLMYTVEARDAGTYEIDWSVAVNNNNTACRIEVDGVTTERYPLENNGSTSEYRYHCEHNHVAPPTYTWTAGKHTVKFVMLSGGYNYGGLRIAPKP
jgi:hypothetical protein